jgi:hypothetical protein
MSASNDKGHPGDVPTTPPTSEAKPAESLEHTRIPPELREWVREQFPPEEFLRAFQEMQEQGGFDVSDLLAEFAEPENKDGKHA